MLPSPLDRFKLRLPQLCVERAYREQDRIRKHVRIESPVLASYCRDAGLPADLAEVCAGLLASVIEDLVMIGKLRRSDWERTKRKERVLEATQEPDVSALRLAIAASPLNGRAAVSHWDHICEKWEIGKLAWLLGMDTETAWKYSRKMEKRL